MVASLFVPVFDFHLVLVLFVTAVVVLRVCSACFHVPAFKLFCRRLARSVDMYLPESIRNFTHYDRSVGIEICEVPTPEAAHNVVLNPQDIQTYMQ